MASTNLGSKIFGKKNPTSSKKQNLNLLHAGNYLHSIYIVLGIIGNLEMIQGAFRVVLVVKNPPASTGDAGDKGLIPESGRSPGEGHGNLLQYSCLENPMDRSSWWVTVHSVAKSQTRL